jgi:phosphoribosylformylglycinamidine synthase subunit PurQ / glutaminase
MKKIRALIVSGYGLNCEEETRHGFLLAGGTGDIVHINDLIVQPAMLFNYQILAIPGGFAYGDDTGAGNAYANKLRNHLWQHIARFVVKDRLVIGICNGFQILVNLGLLPGFKGTYGKKQVALLHNDSSRLIDRWTDLKTYGDSPWIRGIDAISLPIAHGEGKLYTDAHTLKKMKENNMIALRYETGEVCRYQQLPSNPTGTLDDIAGITDVTGRIFGLMPHPERALFFTQLPNWPLLKEKYLRDNKPLPIYGPGLKIFKNAMNYFV